jgi:seryl-tRNA synthetase
MITIDGVEYTEDQLSDEQKYLIAQVQDVDSKLRNLQFQADQLNAARKAFSDSLVESFKEGDE